MIFRMVTLDDPRTEKAPTASGFKEERTSGNGWRDPGACDSRTRDFEIEISNEETMESKSESVPFVRPGGRKECSRTKFKNLATLRVEARQRSRRAHTAEPALTVECLVERSG
jgi:hypothetical protein